MAASWRPARSLTTLRAQVDAAHPGRATASDGMLASAAHHKANPDSDHDPRLIGDEWVVCAIDITKGAWTQAMVDALVASRDPRLKYVIWERRFCALVNGWGSPIGKWVPYTGDNPHTKHCHISVNAGNCDDTRPWRIGTTEDVTIVDQATLNFFEKMHNDLNARIGGLDQNISARLAPTTARLAALEAATAADSTNPVTPDMFERMHNDLNARIGVLDQNISARLAPITARLAALEAAAAADSTNPVTQAMLDTAVAKALSGTSITGHPPT